MTDNPKYPPASAGRGRSSVVYKAAAGAEADSLRSSGVGLEGVRSVIDAAREYDGPPDGAASGASDNSADSRQSGVVDIDPQTGAPIAPIDERGVSGGGQARGLADHVLPPDSMFAALGRNKGVYFFSNSDGQFIPLPTSGFNANNMMDLMDGNTDFALTYWKGGRGALDVAQCRDHLMAACRARGVFNPENRIRGRGAWRAKDGRGPLVIHFGDEIWIEKPDSKEPCFDAMSLSPGLIDKYFYEADEPVLRPWDEPVRGEEMRGLLDQLASWNWARGSASPRLLLGWIAMAMIGGAMEWRPHVVVQGDSGCGKSTLQKLVGYILGPGKVKVEDATEAGLSSSLRLQTLPVMFDEFESEEDNRKALAVIGLMRRSSSGGERRRGSQDHSVHQTKSQSPFFVSMITPPPLQASDLNRLVMLQLFPLDKSAPKFSPDVDEWEIVGRKMFRRVLDGWADLQSRIDIYRAALADLGHGSRGQDTVGILLACADIVLGDEPPDPYVIEVWTEDLSPDKMIEYEGVQTEFAKCIAHILQCQPRRWQKEFSAASIGAALAKWRSGDEGYDWPWIQRGLSFAGLRLVCRRKGEGMDLFVPNSHSAVREMFEGSKWRGTASSMGGWTFALSSGPPAVWRKGTATVSGQALRGVLLDIEAIMPRGGSDV